MKRAMLFLTVLATVCFGQELTKIQQDSIAQRKAFVADSIKWSTIDTSHIYVAVNPYDNGKLIDYIDPQDYNSGEDITSILRNNNAAFPYMPVPRAEESTIRAIVQGADSTKRMDLVEVKTSVGDNRLWDDWHTRTGTESILPKFIDYTGKIKAAKDVDNPAIIDQKAISSGTATTGSGGTYATWTASLADIDAGGLTGALRFVQVSALTQSAQAAGTESLNGYTLTLTSNNPHYGNQNAGWLTDVDIGAASEFNLGFEGAGTIIIEHLKLQSDNQDAGYGLLFVNDVETPYDIYVHHNIFDCNNEGTYGPYVQDADPVCYFYRNFSIGPGAAGLYVNHGNASSIYENNTAYGFAGAGEGIDATGEGGTFRNNLAAGNGTDFANIGSATGNYNSSDDATAADGSWSSGTGNIENITPGDELVSVTDTESRFLALKVASQLRDAGQTPGISANVLGMRGTDTLTAPDIGADEADSCVIYYSVGTSTADLKAGSPTINIVGDTAALSVAQPDTVGVGDVITYNTNQTVYIKARIAADSFEVQTVAGGEPFDTTGLTVNSIKRVFNSLNVAEDDADDAGYMGGADMAANQYRLIFPCYADGNDVTATTVAGYTTSAVYYIKIYTPTATSEVGTTQRHSGNETGGYKLITTVPLNIDVGHIRLDGLYIQDSDDDGTAIDIDGNVASSDIRISNCVIDGNDQYTEGNTRHGILFDPAGASSVGRVWNTAVYDFGDEGRNIRTNDADWTVYCYNIVSVNSGYGFQESNGQLLLKNCVAFGHATAEYGEIENDGANNAGTANVPGADSILIPTSTATDYFVSAADFHIDTSATHVDSLLNRGTDLSADGNIAITDDIDGDSRSWTFDVGADEFLYGDVWDTTYSDTTYDSTCLSLDSLQQFLSDSLRQRFAHGPDTTVDSIVAGRDSVVTDTTGPTTDTVWTPACCSIQVTISACAGGDTTARDTFYTVAAAEALNGKQGAWRQRPWYHRALKHFKKKYFAPPWYGREED